MDAVNLTAFFRTQDSDSDSAELDTASTVTQKNDDDHKHDSGVPGIPDATSTPNGEASSHHPPLSTPSMRLKSKSSFDDVDNLTYANESFANIFATEPSSEQRRPLNGHVDPTNDTLSLRSYWHGLLSPQVYMPIFYALRITLLVALPLGILARHPSVMNNFPAHVILPLWGIVDSRYTFGEQVAFNVVSIQCGLFTMLWGVLNNSWNLLAHPQAWWCSVIFGAFTVSLFGDWRARRICVLMAVLILQMENLPHGTDLIYPVKVGRDQIMSTAFAFIQCLFPIKSVAKECDEAMAAGWKHIGRITRNCVTACWSEDPIECAMALGHISTEPIQALLLAMPQKLFFVMYEVWESTLRLELRKERLAFLGLCMPRLHTMTDAARAMVMKRVHRAHPKPPRGGNNNGNNNISNTVNKSSAGAGGSDYPVAELSGSQSRSQNPNKSSSPYGDYDDEGDRDEKLHGEGNGGSSAKMDVHSREPYGGMQCRPSYGNLADTHGRYRREAEKDEFLSEMAHRQHPRRNQQTLQRRSAEEEKAEGSDRRYGHGGHGGHGHHKPNLAALSMQFKTPVWTHAGELLRPTVEVYLDALDAVLDGLGRNLNPQDTATKIPFAALQDTAAELKGKLNELHFNALIKSENAVDPFLYSNVFVFHLSLIIMAERLVEYGAKMQNFDRSQYKSQWRRAWEFFFYDYWSGFWEELPKRMTLATPRDVRILKDAIKMACAYGVGAMFTAYMDTVNVYYFGMAILMGVGWPTAGDTMEASVYRITGMVCACSIAYVAIWHTDTLTQELAIALAGVFLALIFRDRPPYSHTAGYCSMLVITALNSAGTKLVLLCRIVSNSFAVMTYYAIVVFLFPIDVLRVTYNAQVKAITMVAYRFSRLVDVLNQPLTSDDPAQTAALRAEAASIREDRLPMWAALNAVGTWLPKAAADPAPLGNPYPFQAMRDMYSSLRRLGSATDIIGASVCSLLRENAPTHRPDMEHILAAVAPVMQLVDRTSRVLFQDFLDAIATPHEWSPERTTYHFSVFLSLSRALHHACWTAHRRNVKALRADFRNRVLNRTFAVAAKSSIVNPETLERARNISFAMQPANSYPPSSPLAPPPLQQQLPGSFSPPTQPQQQQQQPLSKSPSTITAGTSHANSFAPVEVPIPTSPSQQPPPQAAEQLHENGSLLSGNAGGAGGAGGAMSPSSTSRNASVIMSGSRGGGPRNDAEHPLSNESISRSIAESVALARSNVRRSSRLQRRATSDVSGSFTSHFPPSPMLPASAAPQLQPGHVDSNATSYVAGDDPLHLYPKNLLKDEGTDVDAQEEETCARETTTFKEKLNPFAAQAQEEERRAFIARRSPEVRFEHENTFSHDVNMVITIMVGTDMFFTEAERLLKTVYTINEYARSRVPARRK